MKTPLERVWVFALSVRGLRASVPKLQYVFQRFGIQPTHPWLQANCLYPGYVGVAIAYTLPVWTPPNTQSSLDVLIVVVFWSD